MNFDFNKLDNYKFILDDEFIITKFLGDTSLKIVLEKYENQYAFYTQNIDKNEFSPRLKVNNKNWEQFKKEVADYCVGGKNEKQL